VDFKCRNDIRKTGIICYIGFIFTVLLEKMIEIKKEKKFFDTVKFYFDMRML
jgi:hypothetical protein